jgi:outer membrane protein assembly factor BamB
MKTRYLLLAVVCSGALAFTGADWPQWRGPHRDAKVAGFEAPATWPKELTQKWRVTIGDGVASPALVGDKLYVFSRQGSNEIVRCLDAGSGNEIWKHEYEAQAATGPSSGFAGPRSSPTVADGKVVTLGVRGTLSCLQAASGDKVWSKEEFPGSLPRFFTSCSPIVADGLCIVQLGGEEKGGIIAFDLASGDEKWKWTDDGTAYSSPALLALDGKQVLLALTAKKIVGLDLSGKLLWETPYVVSGRGYNAATPIVAGQTLIYAGSSRGTRAVTLSREGDGLTAKELWSSPDNSVQFNTPVFKDGLIFGLSDRDELFCLSAADGKRAWTSPLEGRGRLRGYGSVVDAGPVLLALNPTAQLIVYEPTDKEFKKVASYKVSDGETFAYPILSGNRIYIKDKDAVTLWTVE